MFNSVCNALTNAFLVSLPYMLPTAVFNPYLSFNTICILAIVPPAFPIEFSAVFSAVSAVFSAFAISVNGNLSPGQLVAHTSLWACTTVILYWSQRLCLLS